MNPYQILGLPDHASHADVRKKYLLLAKKYHPDHGGNKDDFEKIYRAYNKIDSSSKIINESRETDELNQGKTHISKLSTKDFKVKVPIKKLLINPTVEIILGSSKTGKPIKINVNNSIRKTITSVEYDGSLNDISIRIYPKASYPYSVLKEYDLLLRQCINNEQYNKTGHLSVKYPTGSVAVYLSSKPAVDPLQMFRGLGLHKPNNQRGNMYIQFVNEDLDYSEKDEYRSDGIPVGIPISLDMFLDKIR